ncbi:MAG: SAM-dependent methyltransferase [Magnetospirillum sp. WYHS-4]
MVSLLDPREGELICDPAAGTGYNYCGLFHSRLHLVTV